MFFFKRSSNVFDAAAGEGLADALVHARGGEEDLLDRAWGLTPTSRLSCQAVLSNQDVTIEIPKYTINHARENH